VGPQLGPLRGPTKLYKLVYFDLYPSMVRYRGNNGRYISNRSGRRGAWKRLARGVMSRARWPGAKPPGRRSTARPSRVNSAWNVGKAVGMYAAKRVGEWGLKKAGRYVSKRFTPQRKRRTAGYADGGYSGRFNNPTRSSGRSMDRFNKDGVLVVKEITGEIEDADCVYLMNETVNSRDVIFFSVAAILRKLAEKAGFKCQGISSAYIEDASANDGSGNSTRFFVGLSSINLQTGATTNVGNTLVATDTLAIVTAFFLVAIETYSAGSGLTSDTNATIPYKFYLHSIDASAGAQFIPRAEIRLDECYVEVFGKAEMKVQNRTGSSETIPSDHIDNVRNNPIQGRIYQFSGMPRSKNSGKIIGGANSAAALFERISYPTAVIGFGAGNTGDPAWKEPPRPSQFWNCKKSAYVRLDPGQIKSFNHFGIKTMAVLKLWKSIRFQVTATSTLTTYSVFPCQLLAMEDVINSGPGDKVTIGYEIERTLGVKVSTHRSRFMKTYFEQATGPVP